LLLKGALEEAEVNIVYYCRVHLKKLILSCLLLQGALEEAGVKLFVTAGYA
jgi:hypothetical protein